MFSTLTTKSLRLYQIVGFLVAALIIGIPYLIPADGATTDPVWLRWIIGGLLAATTIASVFLAPIRRHFILVIHGYSFVVVAWLFWLAFVNELRLDYSPTPVICLMVSGVSFRSSKLLWFHLLGLFLLSCSFAILPEAPVLNPIFYLMIVMVVGIGLGILMQNVLADRQKIMVRGKRQQIITDSAFEYSENGILVVDETGRIIDQNPRFLELWQLTTEDISVHQEGVPLPPILAAVEDPQAFESLSRQALEVSDRLFFQEFRLRDGRYLERFSKPLLLDGRPIGRIWFYKDVTPSVLERQQMQRQRELLKAENAALNELASGITDPDYNLDMAVEQMGRLGRDFLRADTVTVWFLDPSGTFLELIRAWSPEPAPFEGSSRTAVQDIPRFLKLVQPERVIDLSKASESARLGDLPAVQPHLAEAPCLLVPLRQSDRLQGFIHLQSQQPLRRWTREERGFAGSLGDIAGMILESLQRKASEKALQDSLQRNRSIVQAVPDMLLRMDLSGHLMDLKIPETSEYEVFQNRSAERLHDMFPEPVVEKILFRSRDTIQEHEIGKMEMVVKMDGQNCDLEVRLVPIGEDEVLVIVREVTARKTTERELLQRNFELDSFVYRASHDLKAPLNSLMGLINIIEAEDLNDEVRSYVQLMDRSVLKLDTFIRNLTEFSRITRLELSAEAIDFEDLAADIRETLQYMDESQRVDFQLEVKGNGPLICDRFHLEIILGNLFSNAIKYQDLDRPDPKVALLVEYGPDQTLIEVSDNGIGIPKKYQDRLFELFFRASNQSFGSGIGLYIIRNAVNKLNGQVQLESQEGVGTTFRIALPNSPVPEKVPG